MRVLGMHILFCHTLLFMSACSRPGMLSPQALALESQCVQSLLSEDYDAAKTRCELCLEYDETVAECLNGLGLVAIASHNDDLAIEKFTEAIQMNQNYAQARNNLGAVHFKRGNLEYALPFFQAAIRIDPGFEDARYNTGLCYLKMAEKHLALAKTELAMIELENSKGHYKKLIALNPEFANAYRDLGLIYLKEYEINPQGNEGSDFLNTAQGYLQKCLELERENDSCRLIYDESQFSFKKKNGASVQGGY